MVGEIAAKVVCTLLIAALVFSFGQMISPYFDIGTLPFRAIEAVLSASIGFGLAGLAG